MTNYSEHSGATDQFDKKKQSNIQNNLDKIIVIMPSMKMGGAERVISQLVNNWSEIGYNVHLILLTKDDKFFEINSEVRIHELGFENKGRIQKIFSEIIIFIKLRKLIKKLNPKSILSFMDKFNVFAILVTRFLNIKVYVSDRNNPFKSIPCHISFLRKYTYRFSNGVIFQTNKAKDVIGPKIHHKNIIVIPNPVRKLVNYPHIKREKIIINMGRLVPEKGQYYLIESFQKLLCRSEQAKNWKLVILGDGPLKNELNYLIREKKIQDKVFLIGAVNNVDEWLSRSSIFVFSSISEGFPNALIEAMGNGLPCISFNCPVGPGEIIENGKNGILVPNKDSDQLVLELKKLIENKKMRIKLGNQAKLVSNTLSLEKISKQYLDFILEK